MQPKGSITWLSLANRPSICLLGAYSQSFKKFKNGFFKVVMNPVGHSHFYDGNDNRKLPFYGIDNPLRYNEWPKDKIFAQDGVTSLVQTNLGDLRKHLFGLVSLSYQSKVRAFHYLGREISMMSLYSLSSSFPWTRLVQGSVLYNNYMLSWIFFSFSLLVITSTCTLLFSLAFSSLKASIS